MYIFKIQEAEHDALIAVAILVSGLLSENSESDPFLSMSGAEVNRWNNFANLLLDEPAFILIVARLALCNSFVEKLDFPMRCAPFDLLGTSCVRSSSFLKVAF